MKKTNYDLWLIHSKNPQPLFDAVEKGMGFDKKKVKDFEFLKFLFEKDDFTDLAEAYEAFLQTEINEKDA